ncbi:MAG TPA: HAD family acid phosphatase [Allosphingosinicella sp.]|nr:HAD family acid phosphatase [Allosphingosinicella sp.]
MKYLYGSGEGAAISVQAWRALTDYVAKRIRHRPRDSVILAAGADLQSPRFAPCGGKPFAAVFDADETVLLNLGFEYDAATGTPYSDARWEEWERTGARQVAPVPGAVDALRALRRMGVKVIFNTNRLARYAAANEAAIEGAGLGPARHGDTLYLQGDDATGRNKDGRRAMIAAHYCVIAMGGDQLGDFSDRFAMPSVPARRAATLAGPIAAKWGAGWFVLPNPVYGTGLKGSLDDVFPAAKRWPTQSVREK